jgi:antitoxin component of RelBE/YafQ-DinJ toxin-antitoxin module
MTICDIYDFFLTYYIHQDYLPYTWTIKNEIWLNQNAKEEQQNGIRNKNEIFLSG